MKLASPSLPTHPVSSGILKERRTAAVEEHLLVCEECRDALNAQTDFIQSLKAALRTQRVPQDVGYFQKSE